MSSAYDADLLNAKKGFDDMYENTPDEQKAPLEDYAMKYYDPNFKISTPSDLAIGERAIWTGSGNETTDLGGSPFLANQSFQQRLQNQRLAHSG